jgi:PAS domain S-box-containing protein
MTSAAFPDALLDTAPCGFISFRDDGCIALVNHTLLTRLGYERDELVGRHVERIFTRSGQLFYQTHFFPLVKMQGSAREVFLLLRTKAGEELGVLCNAVREDRGSASITICVMLEVIERRKYEDALLEAKRSAERANAQLEDAALELEMQHQQMQEQAVELERERAEARRAQEAADAANHAKSDFLAMMSHELRTPLNAIGGYAFLIRDAVYGPLNAEQTEALERIIRSQRHLLGLINDVLNLSRVEAGRVDYHIEDVPLRDIAEQLSAMVEPLVAGKALEYHVEIGDPDCRVRGDREKILQILLNLLSNAVKFTDSGGSIRLRARDDDRPGFLRLEVIDTGRGIPADKLEAIFEPFLQVRADPAKANEGTGLGLAISRNLARGMGGDLRATSELGVGSMFVLTLPLGERSVSR